MPATSTKIYRRTLIASAVSLAFIGAVAVTATIATTPAQAAGKSDKGSDEKNKGDCNKFAKDSQEYKDCMAQ